MQSLLFRVHSEVDKHNHRLYYTQVYFFSQAHLEGDHESYLEKKSQRTLPSEAP